MASALPPRTLRSGKEFSALDMVLGHGVAISTPQYFDVAECLASRIKEQEAAHTLDEPEDPPDDSEDPDPLPFWINPTPSSSSYPLPPPPPPRPRRTYNGPPTEMQYKKDSSKHRRARDRAEEQERNGTPGVKAIHLKRRKEALGAVIQVNVDVNDLPHTKPAWIGNRNTVMWSAVL